MYDVIFYISGIIGLLLIIGGILTKTRKQQALLYIPGGIFLEIYSIFLGDTIFIVLQAVFVITALYEFYLYKKKRVSWLRRLV